jgi:tetrahydromethanopterin S-methyltransferase subunit B
MRTEHDVLKKYFKECDQMHDDYCASIYKAMNAWARLVNPDRRIKKIKVFFYVFFGLSIGLLIGFAAIIYQYNVLGG